MALGQAEPTIPPESLHKTIMKSRLDRVEHADGVPWAEWKAAELNRLFQETGATRQVGQIIARTVEHGERSLDRKL
jgi:hypothetical protein